jgi:hypothetical protein
MRGMLVYVIGANRTGKLHLFYPNTDREYTERFLSLFEEFPAHFQVMSETERKHLKTDAKYKTDFKTFHKWRGLLDKQQYLFDTYDEYGIADRLRIGGVELVVGDATCNI